MTIGSHHQGGNDLYLNEVQDAPKSGASSPPLTGMVPPSTKESKQEPQRKTILGLRRRVFWLLLGGLIVLVIVGAVVGGVVGSRKASNGGSSTSSSGSMSASDRAIAAATMNMTGSHSTNVQVVYQDLDTTDLLYRLIWDDEAAAEQRLDLSPSPRQQTPIAVTTANTTGNDGAVTNVFYLSENRHNSSVSDICQATLQCHLNAENCTVSDNQIISDNATHGVTGDSGLAATLLADISETRVYYRSGDGSVRALVGNDPATNGWQDIWIGSQSLVGSSIGVDFDSNEDLIQVVWVDQNTKELEEIVYSDTTGVNNVASKQ